MIESKRASIYIHLINLISMISNQLGFLSIVSISEKINFKRFDFNELNHDIIWSGQNQLGEIRIEQ